jgi:hypothetical protein
MQRLVTGNSDFAADGSEVSGWCPPHWLSARKDPGRPPGRASERDSRKHATNHRLASGFCLVEKCPPDNFLFITLSLSRGVA